MLSQVNHLFLGTPSRVPWNLEHWNLEIDFGSLSNVVKVLEDNCRGHVEEFVKQPREKSEKSVINSTKVCEYMAHLTNSILV